MKPPIRQFTHGHFWLSNVAPVKITVEGIIYPSVEHAYKSCKSDKSDWKVFCLTKKFSEVIQESFKIKASPLWTKENRLIYMYDCLWQKFNQEPYKTMLKFTGDALLEEGNSHGDKFWGVDLETGVGENQLGKMIMKIRAELKT